MRGGGGIAVLCVGCGGVEGGVWSACRCLGILPAVDECDAAAAHTAALQLRAHAGAGVGVCVRGGGGIAVLCVGCGGVEGGVWSACRCLGILPAADECDTAAAHTTALQLWAHTGACVLSHMACVSAGVGWGAGSGGGHWKG